MFHVKQCLLTIALLFTTGCASSHWSCGGMINPCDYSKENEAEAERVREARRIEWARIEAMTPETRDAYLRYREQELNRVVAQRADQWRQYEATVQNTNQLVDAMTTAGRSYVEGGAQ